MVVDVEGEDAAGREDARAVLQDGVEEEADDVTNQVLAELGLQLDASMADAPTQKLPAAKIVAEEEGDKWMDDLPDLKERLKAL